MQGFDLFSYRSIHADVDDRVPEDGGLGHLQGEYSDQERHRGAQTQDPWERKYLQWQQDEEDLILFGAFVNLPAMERAA